MRCFTKNSELLYVFRFNYFNPESVPLTAVLLTPIVVQAELENSARIAALYFLDSGRTIVPR